MRTTLKTKNGGLWARLTALMVVLLMTTAHGKLMAQTNISTENELRTLLQSGGTGSLTTDITATSGLSVANSVTVTLNGNGHVLSVPVTGADEIGVLNTNPSNFTLLSNSGNLTINDLTLRGGKVTCVKNNSDASLKMVGCTIERSGSNETGGGGLWNESKCYLKNCNISRNNANNGGGFLNRSSGILVFDGCSINENRSLGWSGGGGGGENQSGSTLIVNNCTFANNTSTEIGGAINQYHGKTYVLNSTFVGNISDSYYSASGGAFGMNGGSLYFVNSLMVNNYESKNGSFTDSDLGLYNGTPNFFQYSCYGTVLNGSSVFAPPTPEGWTGSVNAATTGVFSSYRSSAILKPDGTSGETLFNRPIIYQCSNGTYTAPIKEGSTLASGGVATYLSVPDDVSTFSTSTIKLGYGETPTAIGDFALAASTDKVTTNQDGSARVPGAMGSSAVDNSEYVTLTLVKCNNGTVSGDGSLYGDSYPKDKLVSVTATPNAGFMFSGWKVNDSGEVQVTTNPYEFNINSDTKLEAVFEIIPVCKNIYTDIEYGTVQQAVNALTETGQTIQLISNVSLTEKIEIANNKNFTLDLNGYVLKQNNAEACVIDNGGTLTINDHSTTAKHYYTVNADGLWVWDDNNTAGAVNFENLTERPAENSVVCINGGAITGGNVGVENTGKLSFNGGTITGVSAYYYSNSGIYNSNGTVTIDGGIISGNNNTNRGGGIYNYGTLTINSGTISYNTAQYAGGIYNYKGTVTIDGGTISGNIAQNNAGGIYNYDGTLTIDSGTISGNSAQEAGGGIYNSNNLTINGGTISGNSAQEAGGGIIGGNITVSGDIKINGNTISTDESKSNLCLTTSPLYKIMGTTPPIVTIGGLTNGANIGVSVYDVSIVDGSISSAVGVFATNASETDVQYFTADDKRTYIEFDSESNSLKLSHNPETIYVTNNSDYKTDEAPIKGSLRHSIANAIEGDTVKFKLAESNRTIFIENPYAVTKPINIDGGSGITIDGGNNQMTYGMVLGFCNTTLKNITFQNVKSVEGCIEIAYSDAVLTNCVFKDNTVSNGNLGGVSLFIAESKVTINNSLFAGNSSQVNGGAITAYTVGNPTDVTLNNCTFTANSVGTGYDGSAIYACTYGNKGSSRASALFGEDKISSKFAGLVKDVKVINAKAHRGGEMSCNVTLNNTIVVGNTGGNNEIYSEKGCTITANNVLGTPSNWSGVTATGTIEYDSERDLFEDAGNGDYHIIPESQAVDVGDNSKVPASLTTDLEGNNRIVNDIVDLGCYETPVQEVAINIYDNPMGYGEVKIKDNTTGKYLDEEERQHIKIGTSVTIEATPSGDYAFQGWFHKGTNNYFSKTQKFTFDAKENLELEARFTDSVIWIRVKKGN